MKKLSYFSPKLIAPSGAIRNHLITYFYTESASIIDIPNMIDDVEINKALSDNSELFLPGAKTDSFKIGFIGRFNVSEKGIDILLNAFQEVYATSQLVQLYFIGDGEDRCLIEEMSKQYPSNIIIINPQRNIYKYIIQLDCIVLPSRIDPYPLVMLETGFLRVPFIGSQVDGISEVIEDGINGSVFKSGQTMELVEKIKFVLENKETAKKYADVLFSKIAKNNFPSVVIQKYEMMYHKLVENNAW